MNDLSQDSSSVDLLNFYKYLSSYAMKLQSF